MVGIAVSATLPMFGFSVANGSEVGYSREFSELFAKTFLANVTDSEIEITYVQDIYSFNETVYGSKVSFYNTETEKDGYIIFSIDGHINEYSLDGEPETLSDKDIKLYYNGDNTYFAKTKSGEYLDAFGVKIKKFENITKKYFNKKLVEKLYLNSGVGGDGFIEDPESAIPDKYTIVDPVVEKYIDDYNLFYVHTNKYISYDNHCAPTAIMNCMIFFDNNGYDNLLEGSSSIRNNYLKEFEEICEIAGFDNKGMTVKQEANTMLEFVERRYPGQFEKHQDNSVSKTDVEKRAEENVPFIYVIDNHSVYNDHALVGLGYQKFKCTYKGFLGIKQSKTFMFILVADGWVGGSPERYVNFDDGKNRTMVWLSTK